MKRIIAALALLSGAALGVVGCGGDDDDDSAGTAGKSSGTAGKDAGTAGKSVIPEGGAGNEGGSGNGTGNTGNSGNLACDPEADTTCQNAQDCPFVVDGTARTTAQTCGKGCIEEGGTCARDCIVSKLDMSSDCAGCYADFVNCTIAHCVGACLADPDSEGCHTCQEDEGCRPTFNTCSGLPE